MLRTEGTEIISYPVKVHENKGEKESQWAGSAIMGSRSVLYTDREDFIFSVNAMLPCNPNNFLF